MTAIIKLNPVISLNLEELIATLVADNDQDTLAELVRRLDEVVADWDFTSVLAAYFECEMEVFAKEDQEDLEVT